MSARGTSIHQRDTVTRTVCPMYVCLGNHCSVNARVRDGKLVRIEPIERGRICGRGLSWPQRVYDPDRPLYPMKRVGERGEGKFQRITWDEALATIAEKVNAARNKYGSRSIGFIMPGAGIAGVAGASRLAALLEGTVVSSLGAIGDSPVGTARVTGMTPAKGTCLAPGGNDMEDTELNSKLMIIWGNNVAETEQRQMRYFLRAKERGAKLVVVDPIHNVTASKADQWIPVRVGTDAALILSMIWVIHTEELGDLEFMKNYTQGPFLVRKDNGQFLRESDVTPGGNAEKYIVWDSATGTARPSDAPGVNPSLMGAYTVAGIEAAPTYQVLIDEARKFTPEAAAEITGVPADVIQQLAVEYATTKPASIKKGWGILRTYHAHHAERLLFALAGMAGQIGIPGGGVNTMPTYDGAMTNARAFAVPGKAPRVIDAMGWFTALKDLPPDEVPEEYRVRVILGGGSNWIGQWGNTDLITKKVLPTIEFMVANEIFMSTTASYADIVLPATTPFEASNLAQPFFFNYDFQYQAKVIEPLGEARSDLQIFCSIGKALGFEKEFDYTDDQVIETLLQSLPDISVERLKGEGPVRYRGRQAGDKPYVHFADRSFPTDSSRMEFYAEELADMPNEAAPTYNERPGRLDGRSKKYPLTFLNTHSRFHVGGAMTRVPLMREIVPEPTVNINPADARERGIRDGDWVIVFNDNGHVRVRAALSEQSEAGVINLIMGWQPYNFPDGSPNALHPQETNPAHLKMYPVTKTEANAFRFDSWVDVRKAD